MDYTDVFQKACLIQLSTSVWQGQKMIKPSVLQRVNEKTDWLRGRKFLINPELLSPVKTCCHQSRNTINRFALPFPITSIYLVPKEALAVIDERLQYYKNRFWNKVKDFEAVYEAAREEAQNVLGDLFNEADYPLDISRKFRYDWRYLSLSIPQRSTILSPEVYEREKQKFQDLMEETREISMVALRTEFSRVVSSLVERLTSDNGKPKVISNNMFNKLNEFLNEFENRNLFKDDKLSELCEQAKSAIDGNSPFSMRYNELLQRKVKNEMNHLKTVIDAAIEDMPRRKLRLAANDA